MLPTLHWLIAPCETDTIRPTASEPPTVAPENYHALPFSPTRHRVLCFTASLQSDSAYVLCMVPRISLSDHLESSNERFSVSSTVLLCATSQALPLTLGPTYIPRGLKAHTSIVRLLSNHSGHHICLPQGSFRSNLFICARGGELRSLHATVSLIPTTDCRVY